MPTYMLATNALASVEGWLEFKVECLVRRGPGLTLYGRSPMSPLIFPLKCIVVRTVFQLWLDRL